MYMQILQNLKKSENQNTSGTKALWIKDTQLIPC